jgi:hypothetical protein
MSAASYQPLPEPAAQGSEFLRAALDDDGNLVLSISREAMREDPRAWGAALADMLFAAVEAHAGDGNDAVESPVTMSDRLTTRMLIVEQLMTELSLRRVDEADATRAVIVGPTGHLPTCSIGELKLGDRCICRSPEDHTNKLRLMQILGYTEVGCSFGGRRMKAVDLITGEHHFMVSAFAECTPVRRRPDASLTVPEE